MKRDFLAYYIVIFPINTIPTSNFGPHESRLCEEESDRKDIKEIMQGPLVHIIFPLVNVASCKASFIVATWLGLGRRLPFLPLSPLHRLDLRPHDEAAAVAAISWLPIPAQVRILWPGALTPGAVPNGKHLEHTVAVKPLPWHRVQVAPLPETLMTKLDRHTLSSTAAMGKRDGRDNRGAVGKASLSGSMVMLQRVLPRRISSARAAVAHDPAANAARCVTTPHLCIDCPSAHCSRLSRYQVGDSKGDECGRDARVLLASWKS
jgi:hypothetical protein